MNESLVLAQSVIDILAMFLPAFATMLAIAWVCSLFRYDRRG